MGNASRLHRLIDLQTLIDLQHLARSLPDRQDRYATVWPLIHATERDFGRIYLGGDAKLVQRAWSQNERGEIEFFLKPEKTRLGLINTVPGIGRLWDHVSIYTRNGRVVGVTVQPYIEAGPLPPNGANQWVSWRDISWASYWFPPHTNLLLIQFNDTMADAWKAGAQ